MKKMILILSLFSSSYSLAFFDFPVKTSKVEADIVCQKPGGGFAIAWPQKNQPARIWQVDDQIDEGLELTVSEFQLARCPGCFVFKASLMDMRLEGQASNFKLKVIAENDEGQKGALLEATCVPVSR